MIKQLWLAVVGAVALVVALGLGVERSIFLVRAKKAAGTVVDVAGRNDRCGGSKRRNRYPCTKFTANVTFDDEGGTPHSLAVSCGSVRGSNQPVSFANLKEGSSVPVVYAPSNPSRAYKDRVTSVFAAPLTAAGIGIASLLGSLTEGRRRSFV